MNIDLVHAIDLLESITEEFHYPYDEKYLKIENAIELIKKGHLDMTGQIEMLRQEIKDLNKEIAYLSEITD